MTHQEYINLVNETKKHSYLYYVESNPAISDAEFDALVTKIEGYEQANPSHILPDSPTQCVGSDLNGNGRRLVAHRSPMLSQQKAHNIDDVKAFVASVESVLGYTPAMRVEWKIDGVSCSIVYVDGKLVSAATRGNGMKGQDITEHIMAMPSVPRTIPQQGRVEVRGEVVCTKGQHLALGYNDERTAASAILNTSYSDSAKTLVFVPWEVVADGFDSFNDLNKLGSWSFNVIDSYDVTDIDSIQNVIDNLSNNRNADFPVDGLVIKIDNYSDFAKMGANLHHPKGSIAYKFEAESAVATVLDIEIKVARSGRRTPVAHISPVYILGKNISKVNLYSENTMNALGVTVGCSVKVILQNDVTPKIVAVVSDNENIDIVDDTIQDASSDDIIEDDNYSNEGIQFPVFHTFDEDNQGAYVNSSIQTEEPEEEEEPEDVLHSRKYAPSSVYFGYFPEKGHTDSEQEEEEYEEKNNVGLDILAILLAIVAVVGLFTIGVGMAIFFAPLLGGLFK